ncbi:MAG: IS3 family transposase [Desulfotomaculaceae bacterium]|nr:IS3 family transposase [Desulfotomaculaceae bacterium]
MIEPEHKIITVARQCELLNLPRSSYYYVSGKNDRYNRLLMNLIDERYTKMPFCGVAKMTAWFHRQGHFVNQKTVRRLMRLMGLEAIYPKPSLSKASPEHKKYPYLLRNMNIDQPDQVWAA